MRIAGKRRTVPSWAGRPSPRILLVDADGGSAWAHEQQLRRSGYDNVVHCGGPSGPSEFYPFCDCRLVTGGRCPVVEGAQAVVFNLGLQHAGSRAILAAYRTHFPELPVCVSNAGEEVDDHRELLDGCEVASHLGTAGGVVDALERAIRG